VIKEKSLFAFALPHMIQPNVVTQHNFQTPDVNSEAHASCDGSEHAAACLNPTPTFHPCWVAGYFHLDGAVSSSPAINFE